MIDIATAREITALHLRDVTLPQIETSALITHC